MSTNTLNFITTYQFPNAPYSEIRITKKRDGTVWFAIQDVCKALSLPDAIKVFEDISEDEQAVLTVRSGDNDLEINMISDAGLQDLVTNTKKAKARIFFKWVERDILERVNGYDVLGDDDLVEDQPSNIFTFQFHNSVDHEIRTIQKDDGSIWFVAKDVCDTLEIKNSRDAISNLDDDERGVGNADTPGGNQKLSLVSESGLYMLIFRSRKPEAKKFRKWVTSEVLPEIRKTGSYIQAQPQISPKAITAFLQATSDTFWSVEKALREYSMLVGHLRKAKKDISIIYRSIQTAFPEARDTIDFMACAGDDNLRLEVEKR